MRFDERCASARCEARATSIAECGGFTSSYDWLRPTTYHMHTVYIREFGCSFPHAWFRQLQLLVPHRISPILHTYTRVHIEREREARIN